jgi:hypothetical protein
MIWNLLDIDYIPGNACTIAGMQQFILEAEVPELLLLNK